MTQTPTLADATTTDVRTVEVGDPLSEVYAMFQKKTFRHVPVVNGDRLVGIISATDILKLVYDVGGRDDDALRTLLDHQFTLEDAMTTELITVNVGDPLMAVVDHLATGELHCVLVTDEDGSLAGIVTSTDLVRELAKLL